MRKLDAGMVGCLHQGGFIIDEADCRCILIVGRSDKVPTEHRALQRSFFTRCDLKAPIKCAISRTELLATFKNFFSRKLGVFKTELRAIGADAPIVQSLSDEEFVLAYGLERLHIPLHVLPHEGSATSKPCL